MTFGYQREIDGLRALAVTSVIGFHALPEVFQGGFVGVDVFFVISGYLISGIIWQGLGSGDFTLARFYERRIRRILPALSVVLLAVTTLSGFLLVSRDLGRMGKSLAGAALSVSNVVFWSEAGYFAAGSDTKPLLHTWSLAVEEQFYLVYPLFLMALHKCCRRHASSIVAGTLVAGFALSLWGSISMRGAAFYLAPFRGWELLLGGLLATSRIPVIARTRMREFLALTGGALVLGSVCFLKHDTPFPAPGALPACLGTALLIHVGRSGTSSVGMLLATRPMVGIGLISYSLYLWHWPLLVVARYVCVPREGPGVVAAGVTASFVLAAITWRFVEQPIRQRQADVATRTVFIIALAVIAGASGAGILIALYPPAPLGERSELLASAATDVDPRLGNYLSGSRKVIPPRLAPTYGSDAVPKTAVWGDSHGAALLPGIEDAARRHGRSVRFFGYSGSPPLVGIWRASRPQGAVYNEAVLAELVANPTLETVIIAARWSYYLKGRNKDFGVEGTVDNDWDALIVGKDPVASMEAALRGTLLRLTQSGKRVVLVGPIPEFGVDVPRALAIIAAWGGSPGQLMLPAQVFEARHCATLSILAAQVGPRVERINPHELLRRGGGYIAMCDGKPLYRDDDHLSLAGARFVSSAFDPVFAR